MKKKTERAWMHKVIWFVCCAGLIFLGTSVYANDAANTVGSDECESCHTESFNAWKKTHHFKTFNTLPASEKGNEIAEKMGVEMDRGGSLCMSCHFTTTMKSPNVAVAGISCESCHSPAKAWLDIHSAKGIKRENESKEDRMARLQRAVDNGMLRPGNIYRVAENCFQCHTVPNEKLVNVGGHPAGSKFELVSWSQGEVRHNLFERKENLEATAERKRVLYVTGKALDLEYGLRGVAKATAKKAYAIAMIKRVVAARKALKKISSTVASTPEVKKLVDDMVNAAANKHLKWKNEKNLLVQADKVADAAKAFVDLQNSSAKDLSALDALIPKKFKGKPYTP